MIQMFVLGKQNVPLSNPSILPSGLPTRESNLGYLCFSGKISALPKVKPMSADPEHNICGTSVASKNLPFWGPRLGGEGNLSKTKSEGLPVDCRRRLDFRGRWDLVKGEKWSQFLDVFSGFNQNWGQTFRDFTPQMEKHLSSASNHNIFCSTPYYTTWKDKFWIFVTLGPKKVTQSPTVDRTSSISPLEMDIMDIDIDTPWHG